MRRMDVVGICSVEDRAALDGKVSRVAAGWIVQTIADGAQSDHVPQNPIMHESARRAAARPLELTGKIQHP